MINWNCKTPSNSQVPCSAYSKVSSIDDFPPTAVLPEDNTFKTYNFKVNVFTANLTGSPIFVDWKIFSVDNNWEYPTLVSQELHSPITTISGGIVDQLNGIQLTRSNYYKIVVSSGFPHSLNADTYKISKTIYVYVPMSGPLGP
jgi:hypothetical protein